MKATLNILASAIFLIFTACGQTASDEPSQSHEPAETTETRNEVSNETELLTWLDSIDHENNQSVIASGDNTNKAYISSQDSSISLRANMKQDHRIFGYAESDLASERLLLLSIFTNDVDGNPFSCRLGAYYDTEEMEALRLKYVGMSGAFVKAIATANDNQSTPVYFEKRWMVFFD